MRVLMATLLLVVCIVVSAPGIEPVAETRALWVVRTSMTSEHAIRAMVSAAKAAGFNTLFVQVRGRGDAYYAGHVEPRAAALAGTSPTFDPLGVALREARAAGLSVHAWINVNLVADAADLPTSKRHVIRKHPEWLMLPRDLVPAIGRMNPRDPRFLSRLVSWTRGQSSTVEGVFTSPIHEGAVEHTLDVIDDIVEHYPVDGIHLDYIRFPGAQFDFSRATLETFAADVTRPLSKKARQELKRQARSNPLVYVERYPTTWQDFRRNRTTALLRRIRARVVARRPGTLLTAAVVPDAAVARDSRGQDWPAWMNQGLLDAACPMSYTTDADTFRQQVTAARSATAGGRLLAGVGAYRLTSDQIVRHVSLARTAGADGFILFSYDSLVGSDRGAAALAQIGRAVTPR